MDKLTKTANTKKRWMLVLFLMAYLFFCVYSLSNSRVEVCDFYSSEIQLCHHGSALW